MGNIISKKFGNKNNNHKNNKDLLGNKSIIIYLSFLNQKKIFILDYISVHKDEAYLVFKQNSIKKINMKNCGKVVLEVITKNKTLFKDSNIKDYNRIKNIPEITEEIILNKNQNLIKYHDILCFETRVKKHLYEIIIKIDSQKFYLHSIMLKVPVERIFDI